MKEKNGFMPKAKISILMLMYFTISCSSTYYDWGGLRFRCNKFDSDSACIDLPMLKEGCKLEFVPGESIPPQPTEKIILKYDGKQKQILGPNDFLVDEEGGCSCIYISSGEQALEYLRFFSSYFLVHLFTEQKLEIYPKKGKKDCIGVCMNMGNWKKLKFYEPIINPVGDGYEIERFVIKPIPKEYLPTIFREKVLVKRNGQVNLIEEEEITFCCEYTKGLFFPYPFM